MAHSLYGLKRLEGLRLTSGLADSLAGDKPFLLARKCLLFAPHHGSLRKLPDLGFIGRPAEDPKETVLAALGLDWTPHLDPFIQKLYVDSFYLHRGDSSISSNGKTPALLATPSLLAHILSDKFCDGLPFRRQ